MLDHFYSTQPFTVLRLYINSLHTHNLIKSNDTAQHLDADVNSHITRSVDLIVWQAVRFWVRKLGTFCFFTGFFQVSQSVSVCVPVDLERWVPWQSYLTFSALRQRKYGHGVCPPSLAEVPAGDITPHGRALGRKFGSMISRQQIM